eukprot:10898008-Lingulodinium_polyedra.AAC.1
MSDRSMSLCVSCLISTWALVSMHSSLRVGRTRPPTVRGLAQLRRMSWQRSPRASRATSPRASMRRRHGESPSTRT